MKLVVYSLFVAIFTLDFFAINIEVIPRKAILLQELLSILALVLILIRATIDRRISIDIKYVAMFFALVFLIAISAVINEVPSGAFIAGMRYYLKYLPFFLVSAVFKFNEEEILSQLKFLLGLSLIQLPISIYQRLIQFKMGIHSGDEISGTLIISSALSIYLISNIAILVAFYLHRRIPKVWFFILVILLLLPTTINETKGTLILLPIAVIVPVLLIRSTKSFFARLWPIFLLVVFISGVFFPIYDTYLVDPDKGTKLSDFITDSEKIEKYFYGGAGNSSDVKILDDRKGTLGIPFEGVEERVSRLDSIVIPARILSRDTIKLLVGLGIGNVSESSISGLSGHYSMYAAYYGANMTVISQVFWELGLLGVGLIILMLIMLLRDAYVVSKREDFIGAFSLGWSAILVIMIVALPYKNIINFNAISYLFWYFSGYIATQRMIISKKIASS